MAYTLTAGGTDITTRVVRGSIRITQRAYRSSTTLRFVVDDVAGSISVDPEDVVTLVDTGTTIFGGIVRSRVRAGGTTGGARRYEIVCQDYTSLLHDDVVDTGGLRHTDNVTGPETDKQRITWLFSTFGTKGITVGSSVISYVTQMPDQDFTGMDLHESLTEITKHSGARFWVSYSKVLNHRKNATGAATFDLSTSPNNSTTFPMEEFWLEDDTSELCNAVYVIGAESNNLNPVNAVWVTNSASITAYGRRERVLVDTTLTTPSDCTARGQAFIDQHKDPRQEATVVIDRAGVVAGQSIDVTHNAWGLSAETFTVMEVETFFEPNRSTPRYRLTLGTEPPASLHTAIGGAYDNAGMALTQALDATNTPWFLAPPYSTVGTNGSWPAANRAVYIPVLTNTACLLTGFRIRVATSSGFISLGLYREDGSKIAETGTLACPAAGGQTLAVTADTPLVPGRYYIGWSCSTTAAQFVEAVDDSVNQMGVVQYQDTAHPIPTSMTPLGLTSFSPCVVAIVSSGHQF